YETNPILNISIEASNGELTDEATVTINLTDVDDNQIPTDLKLDNKTINENEPDNSLVGNFSTTDLDSGDNFTYELVTGNGDTDNKAFTINNDQLKINNSPNYENQSSYSILVQTTDKSGASYQKQLTIKVKNINEAPEIINQSFDIAENSENQNLIGTINATDPENDTLKFSIINNIDTNKDGNSAFILDGDRLLVNDSKDLDYETNHILNFNVEVSDEELKDEATITVNLSDIQELEMIENEGTASLAKNKNDSTYWIVNGDKELQLKNRQGKNYSDNTTQNWNAVAVELGSADSYRILLQGQNARDGQAYVWTTDSEGMITKGSGWKSGDALSSIEKEFNIDLNNDELIGSPLTIIEDEGTATFAKNENGNYSIIYG
ncbi:MAG: cadherin domain-containing protein, partial [Trichodesmium sp. St19_bin1]|nr:cadherin domain-containing protein [Trichodesmium sp. St19_bin1]